jgi:vancomycin resistance protein YoaR
MGNISEKAAWLVLCSLLAVLSGCAGQSAQGVPGSNSEKPAQSEEAGQAGNERAEDGKKEKEAEPEEKKPVTVAVIDPLTKSAIKTIIPEELGYGLDGGKYKAELEKWARELARGTETEPGYDQRNTPDRLDEKGNVIEGKPRVILEEAEFVEKVLAASEKGGAVELPLYMTASGYQAEDAAHLDEVVVASYTTYFNSGVAGRTKNIELSAEAIHNVIIGEGDHFSFNTTVGPSDEEHGYQPAEEAINGKLVMGIGGGICQTSSTLFNAVDQLGVDYVEKHHHSVTVGYVPKGRDATVSYGGKDFRFQNTTGAPLLLRSVIENGKLTIEVRTSKQYEGILKKGI